MASWDLWGETGAGAYNSLDPAQEVLVPSFLSLHNILIPSFLHSFHGGLELPKHILYKADRVRDGGSLCGGD